jgi:hypothetical protein
MTYDFHEAFGQYNIYNFFLGRQQSENDRLLYLAVPEEVYNTFFTDEDIEEICNFYKVKIIVFDVLKIEIISWLKR